VLFAPPPKMELVNIVFNCPKVGIQILGGLYIQKWVFAGVGGGRPPSFSSPRATGRKGRRRKEESGGKAGSEDRGN